METVVRTRVSQRGRRWFRMLLASDGKVKGANRACRRNMRSSSLSNLESSALGACMEHGGMQRGAVDVGKGAGPAEGSARSYATAHNSEAGSGRAGAECALGTQAAGAAE